MRFVVRNLVGNYLVYAASIVAGLILTPVILDSVGTTAYGVWAFIGSLVVFLRVLDLGVGPAVVRHSAYFRGSSEPRKVAELASCGLAVYLAVGAVVSLAGLVIAWFVPVLVSVPESLERGARVAAFLTVVSLALELPLGLFANLLKGRQRYDVINAGALLSLAVYAVLIVVVLREHPSLGVLAAIALVATLIRLAVPVLFVRRELPELRLSRRLVSRERLKELLSFSSFTFVSHIASKIVFSADTILIGLFLGAQPVAFYAVASRLFSLGTGLSATGSDLVFPAYSELEGRGDRVQQTQYLLSALRASTCVVALVAAPLIVLPGWVLRAWLPPGFGESEAPLMLLALTIFFTQPAAVMSQYLLGRGKPRALAAAQISFGLVNLAVTSLLLWVLGEIWAAALATLLLEAILAAIVLPVVVGRVGVPYRALAGTWIRVVAAALPAAAVTLVPAALLWGSSDSLAGVIAVGVVWTAVFAPLAWLVALTGREHRAIRGMVGRPRRPVPEPIEAA